METVALPARSLPAWRDPRQWVWFLLGIAPALSALFTPRLEWGAPSLLGSADPVMDAAYASLANRLLNILILAACICNLAVRKQQWHPRSWHPGLAAFFACTLLLPLGLLIRPMDSLPSGTVVWPLVAATLLLAPPEPVALVLARARSIALFYVYASLGAAVLLPGWALQPDYHIGVIPGLTYRLYGLSAHANQLSMIAFLAFLICLHRPRLDRHALAGSIAAVVVIVFTQSKSFFVILPLALAIRWCHLRFLASPVGPGARLGFAIAMVLTIACTTVGMVTLADDRVLANEAVATFTARTAIWEVTMEEWGRYPLLGYGPGLWDQTMAERYEARLGQIVGGHSHSQFIQVLGQSGIVGMLLFLVTLVWLFARSLAAGERPDGFGVSLALAIIVRSAIEPFYYPQIIDLGALSFIIALRICAQRGHPQEVI